MLSFRRLAVTASIAAALAVPAAAQARPDLGGPNWDDNVPVSIDKVSPDNVYGIPDSHVKFVPTPDRARASSPRPTTGSSGATPPSAAGPRWS